MTDLRRDGDIDVSSSRRIDHGPNASPAGCSDVRHAGPIRSIVDCMNSSPSLATAGRTSSPSSTSMIQRLLVADTADELGACANGWARGRRRPGRPVRRRRPDRRASRDARQRTRRVVRRHPRRTDRHRDRLRRGRDRCPLPPGHDHVGVGDRAARTGGEPPVPRRARAHDLRTGRARRSDHRGSRRRDAQPCRRAVGRRTRCSYAPTGRCRWRDRPALRHVRRRRRRRRRSTRSVWRQTPSAWRSTSASAPSNRCCSTCRVIDDPHSS